MRTGYASSVTVLVLALVLLLVTISGVSIDRAQNRRITSMTISNAALWARVDSLEAQMEVE